MRIVTAWFIGVVSLGSLLSAAEPATGPLWRTDFPRAEQEARDAGRPLVIHFYADWCGPCRRMERETLDGPEMRDLLTHGAVGVKCNIDRHPELVRRFRVNAVPTDVIVSPTGQVLHHTEGYQSKTAYLAAVRQHETRGKPAAGPGKLVASGTPAGLPTSPGTPATPVASLTAQEKLPPKPTDEDQPQIAGTSAKPASIEKTPPAGPDEPAVETPAPRVPALDGYCPVTLFLTRTWKPGIEEFSLVHDGQLYHFASVEQRDLFHNDPARYAPQLLGCDPVILYEKDLAVPGTTRFGAYFDGELFLFDSAENRARFRADPTRFSKTKHVLNPDDVRRKRA